VPRDDSARMSSQVVGRCARRCGGRKALATTWIWDTNLFKCLLKASISLKYRCVIHVSDDCFVHQAVTEACFEEVGFFSRFIGSLNLKVPKDESARTWSQVAGRCDRRRGGRNFWQHMDLGYELVHMSSDASISVNYPCVIHISDHLFSPGSN
jgi:hypothetical protein